MAFRNTSFALVVVVVLTSSATAAAQSAGRIARSMQRFYDRTRSFEARFEQRYRVKAYAKEKRSEGRVAFEKPGKMSFRYSDSGNRVVADGKKLKVYEASNRQLFEQPMSKSQYPVVLAFLIGGGKLTRTFRLRRLDEKKIDFTGGYVLSATPKIASPAYRTLLLYVDAATYHVRRVIVLDAQGNRNRFDFSETKLNPKIPAAEFQFTAPAGTQVMR